MFNISGAKSVAQRVVHVRPNRPPERLDVACSAKPSHIVINGSKLLPYIMSPNSFSGEKNAQQRAHAVLAAVLPHVQINGEPISMDRVLPWGPFYFAGPIFPIIHRDPQVSVWGAWVDAHARV